MEKDSWKKEKMSLENMFLQAYDNYSVKILRHIFFRVSDKEIAEDMASETFFKTWQYLREGNKIKNISGFLYRVANNLIIDYYRGKSKKPLSLEEIAEPFDNSKIFHEDKIDMKISFDLIKKYLDLLPDIYSQILIYRFIDELSISEIKELTGKSTANIYIIIHRAIKILRKNINERKNQS